MNKKDKEVLKKTYQQILKEVEAKKEVDKKYIQFLRKRINSKAIFPMPS